MDGTAVRLDDTTIEFQQRFENDVVEFEEKRSSLRQERQQLEKERRDLERERREFVIQKRTEKRQREQEKQLFEMKWKILEEELQKLAEERSQMQKQRNFYKYLNEQNCASQEETVRGELFFIGVQDAQTLKKRYKDLLKIYHPDNASGDTETVLEIKREYEKLKTAYTRHGRGEEV